MSRIYLDQAATSWPKPPAVLAAVQHAMLTLGAPAGRGGYPEAIAVDQAIHATRQALARLLQVTAPHRIVFTHNGTDALNLALHGLLRPGDHVVTTTTEHNSVLRPLHTLAAAGVIHVTYLPCDAAGMVELESVRAALADSPRLLVLSHASNVTGALQPAAEIGSLCKAAGTLFLLDAAQTLGHVPVEVPALHADLVAASGHKGLLGPLGTGMLYLGPDLEDQLHAVRQGGTGTRSDEETQPAALPEKYEAGNLNVPGILGLAAGVQFIETQTLAAIRAHEQALTTQLLTGLANLPGVTLHGPATAPQRVGVVSLTVAGYAPQEVAAVLESAFQIQCRAGLHCAPRMHTALGTQSTGGTVRLSFGWFNTPEQIAAAVAAIQEIAASAP